ncbi:MsnO8 family LLM class oxidoreductase [Runella sp.]|uniref:MsnO8 family LLM class oxidoreductase n=1 Tax=Runella sp. TaxID=1960881 RepID=UPI003D105FB7
MKLSIVDLSPLPFGGTRRQAIQNTLETAQKAEEWGYNRIWLAEHHNTENFAGRAPEVLIPYIAANTKKIRVGSGSVLLNHYSPFKVAEVFGILEDSFPGRIDMGIGRATTGPVSDFVLQRNREQRQLSDDSDEQITELCAWLNDGFDAKHPFNKVKVYNDGTVSDLWLLGSSSWSAAAAARLGLRYAFAGFINPTESYSIAQHYRRNFKPSADATGVKSPELIISLSVYCAESREQAAALAAPAQLMVRRMRQGDLKSPMETEANAIRILGGVPEPEELTDPRFPPRYLIGTPESLKTDLEKIGKAYGSDEIMVQCITANHHLRLQSLKLLSQVFELS